jgi:hypothetical protein
MANLNYKFNISKFDLTNFEPEEIEYLEKYGSFLEALFIGSIRPKTRSQNSFIDYFAPLYDKSLGYYHRNESSEDKAELKVWEKVLLSKEYYNQNLENPEILEKRNYFIYIYFKFFNIREFVNNISVYLQIDGKGGNWGGDGWLSIKYNYKFLNKGNDLYINSLFNHDKLGQTVHGDSNSLDYQLEGKKFLESDEAILLQIDCKKIEVEMKLKAIETYSRTLHSTSLQLDTYKHNPKSRR